MNLPNLPTDNLYKFLALFGLVITVSSTYFYVSETHRLEDFANQLDQTSAHLNIRFDAIDNEQSHLKEKYNLLLDSDATKENRFEITNNIVADIDAVAQRLERARIDSATAKMNENRFSEMLVGCADSKYTQRIVLINCLYGRRNYIPFKWCR